MKKKRHVWPWIFLILLIAGGFFLWQNMGRGRNTGPNYAADTVRIGTLETYYHFSGSTAVRNSQTLTAKANVVIREIYCAEEQHVSLGDALLRLSNGEILRADIPGEVTSISVDIGDTVNPGMSLLTIVDFDTLKVLANVDEYDILAIAPGREAEITVNALGLTYTAVVERIDKVARVSGNVHYYEATLSAPNDPRVLPGMKVDVQILAGRAEDTLLVPMNALHFDSYNKPYIFVRNSDGEIEERAVTVGLQDGFTVELLDGAEAGETILLTQQIRNNSGLRFNIGPQRR